MKPYLKKPVLELNNRGFFCVKGKKKVILLIKDFGELYLFIKMVKRGSLYGE